MPGNRLGRGAPQPWPEGGEQRKGLSAVDRVLGQGRAKPPKGADGGVLNSLSCHNEPPASILRVFLSPPGRGVSGEGLLAAPPRRSGSASPAPSPRP